MVRANEFTTLVSRRVALVRHLHVIGRKQASEPLPQKSEGKVAPRLVLVIALQGSHPLQ
jgi:hypothetical protein